MEEVTIKFDVKDYNYILNVLVNRPFKEVNELIINIENQMIKQKKDNEKIKK